MNPFHNGPVQGCRKSVHFSKLMCSGHWRLVPSDLQRQVYAAYNQGRGQGSQEHVQACLNAVNAVNSATVAEIEGGEQ